MLTTQTLIQRLCNVWWSPIPGPLYRERATGKGVGSVAWKDPGAFNLYWLLSALPHPSEPGFINHLYANISLWQQISALARREVQGYPIAEHAVVLRPRAFAEFIAANLQQLTSMEPLGPTAYGYVADPKGLSLALNKALALSGLPR